MRPYSGGPSKVWTDEMVARARVVLGRHRTLKAAADELGVSASGLQSAFWARREVLGGGAREFLFGGNLSVPLTGSANHSALSNSSANHPAAQERSPAVADCAPARAVEHNARVKRFGSWGVALPDMHVPFHSQQAVDLVCFVVERIAKLYRPSLGDPELILLGDYLDCLEVSKHRKDPELSVKFSVEVERGVSMRIRLEYLAGWLAKTITLGNHENRLRNYILDQAPALEGIVPSIGDLLAMPANGWNVVPYGDRYVFGDLNITHDLDTAGMYAHNRSMAAMGGSTLIGHTHRIAMTCTGNIVHGPQTAAMIGWLGDPEHARYIKRPLRAHWRHGFGLLYRDVAGHTHVVPVPIAGGRCVVGGTIYDLAELSGRKAA